MRLAVISDIHGNLVALEAVLADLEAAGGADLTWCLGDLAAFGPRPAECVARIRGRELWHEVEGYGTVIGYHAVPGNDESFLRPETSVEEAADYLLDREGHLGIGGHTHFQMDRQVGRWRLVNVGSVGLSFENPGMAQYGLFDFAGGDVTVILRQVAYDVAAVIDDLQAVGHPYPQWFINRIRPQPEA